MVPRSAAFVNGVGKVPAAPSHGLCGSAGGLPSQSPNGDSVSAAASVGRWATSHRDVAAPEGRAKSRLPLWGRWTRVSEDGEGQVPAAPSHGLCRSAGGLPSQSPSGDSSPEGRAKSRLPLWERCPPKEGGEGNCSAVREKRFAVSLVSLWLTPTKVKGKAVGLCPFSPAGSVRR